MRETGRGRARQRENSKDGDDVTGGRFLRWGRVCEMGNGVLLLGEDGRDGEWKGRQRQ